MGSLGGRGGQSTRAGEDTHGHSVAWDMGDSHSSRTWLEARSYPEGIFPSRSLHPVLPCVTVARPCDSQPAHAGPLAYDQLHAGHHAPDRERSVFKEGKLEGLVCGALKSQVPALLHQPDPSHSLSATA